MTLSEKYRLIIITGRVIVGNGSIWPL